MIHSTFVKYLIICNVTEVNCEWNAILVFWRSDAMRRWRKTPIRKDPMMCTLVSDGHTCDGHTIRNPPSDPTSGQISIQSHFLPIVTQIVCFLPLRKPSYLSQAVVVRGIPSTSCVGPCVPLSMPLDIISGVRHSYSKRDIFSSLVTTIIRGHDNSFYITTLQHGH